MKNIYTTVKCISVLIFVMFIFNNADAQIGIDNDNPNLNSSLDLGAEDKGMLPNRLSTNQRVNVLQPNLGMDDKGMWVFDIDLNLNYFWDGGQWIAMSSGSLSGSGEEGAIAYWGAGNTITGTQKFYWDHDYARLGIGTTDPAAALHIDNDADVALRITNSGEWAISEYLVGIERTVDPIGGTDLLQLKVPNGSDVDWQFLQCNYGDTPVLKINGTGHLNATTLGAGTDNNQARFNIEDSSWDLLMDVKGGGTPSVLDYMVNFERTAVPYSGIDMIRMKLPEGSPDDTQFIEFERGGEELVQINGNGDVVVKNGGNIITHYAGLNTGNVELNGGDVLLNNGGSIKLNRNDESRAFIGNSTSGTYLNFYNNDETRTIYLRSGGTSSSSGATLSLKTSEEEETVTLNANSTGGAYLNLRKADGTSTITFDSEYNGSGKGRVTCDEIRLMGGADLAEYFDIIDVEKDNQILEPGTIVSIDPDNPGKLIKCNVAYDTKVAGIISGANGVDPGMLMGHDNTIASGDYPVALTGRVYVKADNSNGDIKPGDFLTTSAKTGHAMKVRKMKKAEGAIIGKAMTSLDEKDGFVLVLVSLQ